MPSNSPIRFMWLVFIGFGASLAYGLAGAVLINTISGSEAAQHFLKMYIGPFNTFITLGLGIGTALIIGKSQRVIPETIETAFEPWELSGTEYYENRQRYFSIRRTITFASELIIIGFVVLHYCQFPFSGVAESVMLVAGCLQCGLASYAGRKIRYAGMMIHSLLDINIERNLFKKRELNVVHTYVQMMSVLTVIGIYIGVRSYYGAPFLYDTFLGRSAQVFLILPVIIATPVLLIFNFYPREVLRRIYDKSIEVGLTDLRNQLRNEALSDFEKELRLMEFEKMYREELRYNFQLALSDLPLGITIVVMVLEPIIKG